MSRRLYMPSQGALKQYGWEREPVKAKEEEKPFILPF
jgi:hypothetical protein